MVTADPVAIDELKRETRRCLELTHPHIVRIYDFMDDAHSAAIAMEFIDGSTLSLLRIEKPARVFEAEEIAPWMADVCGAIGYAHRKAQVVHRDLKPANLMVNSQGEVKVADFGIARSISDSVSRVSARRSSTAGTLAYMSPQQADGRDPAVADDIYSMGATIYELLTGKPPFYSGNIQHQMEDIVPPSMTERRTGLGVSSGSAIPGHWESAVAACLAKDPAERPQSMEELAERLTGTAVPATPPVAVVPRPPTSRRLPVLAAGLVLLASAGAAGWYFGIHQPAEHARQAEIAKLEDEARASRDAEERARKQQEAEQLRTAKEKADAEATRLAAARGGLEVLTDPPGAAVKVGGVAKGESPVTFSDLRLGEYPVMIELPGYDPVEKSLTVAENQFANSGLIKLQRSMGTAQIISEPAGQPFELRQTKSPVANEEPVLKSGMTPATLEGLPTGTYAVRISRVGWPDYRDELTVERGEVHPLKWEFSEGTVKITSEPAGADVFINGKAVGATPYAFAGPTGDYTVELRQDGWPSYETKMTVAKGANADLPWEFASGSATIASTPPGVPFELRPKNPALDQARHELAQAQARYAVKGLSAQENSDLKKQIDELPAQIAGLEKGSSPVKGTTPATLSDLPAGTYTVEIIRPGWPDYRQEMTVAKGTPARASAEFAQGTLEATSVPAGVPVSMGGRALGKTPLKITVPNGSQTLRFEMPDWPAVEKKVDVPANGTAQAAAEFRGGAVRLTSDPSGALVSREDRQLGKTPLTLENQPPGPARFTLSLGGYRRAATSISIQSGKVQTENVALQKLGFAGTWRGRLTSRFSNGSSSMSSTRTITIDSDLKNGRQQETNRRNSSGGSHPSFDQSIRVKVTGDHSVTISYGGIASKGWLASDHPWVLSQDGRTLSIHDEYTISDGTRAVVTGTLERLTDE